ncbi:DUF3017 domain-containing protein [Spongiactinospora sp. TRM90649]|uniref:DUF3017 domain-containing protein n=1 Tax=Spongiactinospora sp. TRM90649 TaxID=3031114 RepID=UPI0023F89367|nr:DUF3017 domain-containing protein [Spongiactinospora sp. TRM90649]MDF5751321.1 DUF3017 domain-containing protein [Spongiactinospora sp. TRM90649]
MTEQQRNGWGPYTVILTGTLSGLSAIMLGAPSEIMVPVLGGFFLLGAALRGLLPVTGAGPLAVRGRTTDVVTLGLLGVLLVFGGLVMLVPRDWIIG